jgi:SAM-dependent methyltransferase
MDDTLEVAIGTGLNLPHYPPTARLTGVDLSPEMLEIAAQWAAELGREVALREGDALDLPFSEGRLTRSCAPIRYATYRRVRRCGGEQANTKARRKTSPRRSC